MENQEKYISQTFTSKHTIGIPGDIFIEIIKLLQYTVKEGTKVDYFPYPSKEEFENQKPQVSLNTSAYIATLLEPKLKEIAKTNVDNGNSVSIEDKKPKFILE